ncbi:START domain-containing protein [Gallaecimonas kandeliae]|uniref:START domain-containing protein n=1 Tax=Gallaecimonas kandeliae TaxID=3029055 RepID=UPI002647324D|nr:START domain-containing protein [Gallaecimonas kandeliae]WKE63956.1 START domain-containing protein [Gallaecimonas kandeliae]
MTIISSALPPSPRTAPKALWSSQVLLGPSKALCLLLLLSGQALADWEQQSQDKGVSLWTRQAEAGLVEVRAQCEVVTRLSAFVAIMEDMAAMPDWVAYSSGVERLAKPSSQEDVIHSRFDLPWPARNRDMVTLSRWSQDSDFTLHLKLEDQGQAYPKTKGYVRMEKVEGEWILSPQGGGLVQIRYQGLADPAGWLPHWLVNQIAVKSTAKTLGRLCHRIQGLRYQDSRYPFVTEPPATRTRSEEVKS